MTTMIKKISVLFLSFIFLASMASVAQADDWYLAPGGYYTVNTQEGKILFTFAGQITVDDEYISGDNKRYRVVEVDDTKRTAVARYVEDVVLWEGYDSSMINVSAQQGKKKVALYCTHTDESYIPGDGSEAKPDKGGIIDVANQLCEALKKDGIDATVDDTSHEPHDAGAYRRSRSSAMNLMEQVQPDLMLDVHRDGVPNAKEYDEKINGQDASKCRFVIGRSNQNRAANENTAKKIKQVADTKYPGLVKDIFIGHGSYNQDLTPNSMIVEIGTHTIEKQRVMTSTNYIADVVASYLGAAGGQNQAQGQGQGQNQSAVPKQQSAQQPGANRAAAGSIAWIIGIVGGVCLLFLLVATVNGQRRERVGNFFREVTGMGKHRDKDK